MSTATHASFESNLAAAARRFEQRLTSELREHAAAMLRQASEIEQMEGRQARGIIPAALDSASYEEACADSFLAEAYEMCADAAICEELDRIGEAESLHPVQDAWALAFDIAIGTLHAVPAFSADERLVIALARIARDIERNERWVSAHAAA